MKKMIIISTIAALAINASAYDYSVLNLQDRMGSIRTLIATKVSSGQINFDDFSDELKEKLGGNVKNVEATEDSLVITYNDGTSKILNISDLVKDNFLKSGMVVRDKIILTFNDGRVLKVNLNPLLSKINRKIEELKDSLDSEKSAKNIYIDPLTRNIIVVYSDDTTSTLSVKDLVPQDKYTKSGEVSISNKVLTMTLSDGDRLKVNLAPLFEQRDALLSKKVDKEPNKTLTTNDFTNKLKSMVEKQKVEAITLDSWSKLLRVQFTNGSVETIDFSKLLKFDENHVESGRLSLGGKSIVLTRKDGSDVSIDIERIYDEIDNKVDNIDGKSLSTYDFSEKYRDMVNTVKVIGTAYDKSTSTLTTIYSDGTKDSVVIGDTSKVDKESGKTLTSNDFTNDLKEKVELKKVLDVTRSGDVVTIHYTDGTSIEL